MGMHRLVASLAFLLAISTVSHSRYISHSLQNTIQWAMSEPGVCLTPGCIKAADQILSNMDQTADPCENFYQFACGGYLKKTVIPDNRSQSNVFLDAQTDLDRNLIVLLEKESELSDPPYAEMLKKMYRSCMDLDSIERNGDEPLRKRLRQLGGWPVVEGGRWDESGFDWIDTIILMQRLGYSSDIIFELGIGADLRNNKVHMLALDQASLGMLDRSYLLQGLSDQRTAAYFRMMVDAAKLLGADEATAERDLLKALEFEKALANYSMAKEERRDYNKLYNKYTIGEIQNLAPRVPWLKYFNGLLNDEVDENQAVIVPNPNFIDKVSELVYSTDKRVIANYMMWRVVMGSMGKLSKEWRDVSKSYEELFTGSKGESERSAICLRSVTGILKIATGSYYVKNYFKEESKQAALVLVDYIREEFLNILNRIDWMDEDTRREAIAKAKAITPYIGYPAELADDAAVMKYYENLTITSGNYFDNIMSLRRWAADVELSKLRKPNVKGNWITHGNVVQVNAYYNPQENSIDFPASILQNAFFDKDRPYYMNFGGIGYVIGHEITHGFDDQGRQFDKEGNTVNWWGKDTDESFTQKAQCIIDQYSNYTTETGMKLNGINTLGENIADNGGMKEAYKAYQSWVEDNGLEQTLPGLDFTQNQLFWISAANAWCSKYREELLKYMIVADNHSPAEYRIIGPMSNLPEFSRTFGCPPGTPMNKLHKCQVW